ncbi:MAG: mechanosensitive ion channel [Phycisphaerales bacterium]|nr:mechanosensitive ion channel [Phycisphaerales bacterium]
MAQESASGAVDAGTTVEVVEVAPAARADEAVKVVNDAAAQIFGEGSWASEVVLGNALAVWIAAAGLAALVYLAVKIVRSVALSRLRKVSQRTVNRWDDLLAAMLGRVRGFFAVAAGVYAGSLLLALPAQLDQALRVALVIAFAVQAGMLASVVVEFALERLLAKGREDADAAATREALKTGVGVLKFIALLLVYAVIALMALDNMGVDVTAMVASLGIGGIAIALAVQNILGDLFGSLTIVLDKPFEVGDFIIVGQQMGTVERVGLKTTRVRALSGEQLVFSNSDLLGSRVQNYKRMQQRRAVFTLAVTYDTEIEQLEGLPALIRSIIESEPLARHDRTHFARFKDAWLEFESVYFVTKPDMALYLDTQQSINLKIIRAFRERGVQFAFPTQTIWHEGLPRWIDPRDRPAGPDGAPGGDGGGYAGAAGGRP